MNELETQHEILRYLNNEIPALDLEVSILDAICEQELPRERCRLGLEALALVIGYCEGSRTEDELRSELEILSQDQWLRTTIGSEEELDQMILDDARGGSNF